MTYIRGYLIKIIDSKNQIFVPEPIYNKNKSIHTSQSRKQTESNKFSIHRHLTDLNSQMETEITELIKQITIIDKNIDKYSRILSHLGDFKQLYNEYKETAIKNNTDNAQYASSLYRYNKKEDHINYTIKFLNDIINQIKNRKLSNPLNKDTIRPQFKEFLKFGDSYKLFNILGDTTRKIYNFSRLFKSKNNYKVLYPEMVSNIIQYLNILSLVNMFDILDTYRLGQKTNEIINYKFNQYEEPDENVKEFRKYINVDMDTTEDEDKNFIESFDIKKSDNLKIVSDFIIIYLNKINDTQILYDSLTIEQIHNVVSTHDQKLRDANLKGFEWLSREGNEEERQLVFLKMKKLKKLDYAGIAKYLKTEYGDRFNQFGEDDEGGGNGGNGGSGDNNILETDDYEGEVEDVDRNMDDNGDESGNRNINENGLANDELDELPNVYDDEDDNADGDQDYDNLAADNGDY